MGFRYRLPIRGEHFFLLPNSWYPEEPDDWGGIAWFAKLWLELLDFCVAVMPPILVVIFAIGAVMRLVGASL